jgi:hypothetical protein
MRKYANNKHGKKIMMNEERAIVSAEVSELSYRINKLNYYLHRNSVRAISAVEPIIVSYRYIPDRYCQFFHPCNSTM